MSGLVVSHNIFVSDFTLIEEVVFSEKLLYIILSDKYVVEKGSNKRQENEFCQYTTPVGRNMGCRIYISWVYHDDIANNLPVILAGAQNKGGGLPGYDHITLFFYDIFDKVVDELHIQIVCLCEIGLFRPSASEEIQRVNGSVLGKCFDYIFPLVL